VKEIVVESVGCFVVVGFVVVEEDVILVLVVVVDVVRGDVVLVLFVEKFVVGHREFR
jgi:hypothetical protein